MPILADEIGVAAILPWLVVEELFLLGKRVPVDEGLVAVELQPLHREVGVLLRLVWLHIVGLDNRDFSSGSGNLRRLIGFSSLSGLSAGATIRSRRRTGNLVPSSSLKATRNIARTRASWNSTTP